MDAGLCHLSGLFVVENNNNIDVQTPDIESREAFANHDLPGKLLEIEGIEIQTLRDYGIGLDVHKSCWSIFDFTLLSDTLR